MDKAIMSNRPWHEKFKHISFLNGYDSKKHFIRIQCPECQSHNLKAWGFGRYAGQAHCLACKHRWYYKETLPTTSQYISSSEESEDDISMFFDTEKSVESYKSSKNKTPLATSPIHLSFGDIIADSSEISTEATDISRQSSDILSVFSRTDKGKAPEKGYRTQSRTTTPRKTKNWAQKMESTATATETEQDSSITEESFYLFGDKWIGPREDINTDTDASNPEIKTESTLFKRPLQKRVIPDMSPYSRPGRLKAAKKKFQKKSAKKVQSESRVNKYDLRSASHQNTIDYQQYKDLENSYDLETAGMGSDVSSASEYDPKQTKEPKKKNRRVSLEDSWNMDIEPLSEPSEYLNEPILEHKEKKKTVKFDSPKPSQYKKIREKQRTPFPETLRSSALMQGANTSVGPIVQSGKRRVGRPRKSDLLVTQRNEEIRKMVLKNLQSQGIVAGQAILQSLLPQIQEKAPINADNPFSDDESHEPIFPIHHELPFEKKKMNVYAQLTEELELNTTVTPVNAFKPACQYNPFFLYNKAVRGSIYKMNPQLTTAQVSRLIAQQWKDLNPTEKEKYNQESADKRAQLKKARGYRGRNERFPPNGYVLFSKDCGAKLRKEQPHCTLQDVAKLASSQWKTMDPELKQQYNTTSATLRAKFVEENPDYVKARNEKLYMAVKKTVERKKVIRLLKKEMEEQENS